MRSGKPTSSPSREPAIEPAKRDADSGLGRIRCPLCHWEPSADSRWSCNCRHLWNTFDTGGICPGCLKQWKRTMCLQCHRWSNHSDWYPKY